MMTPWLESLNDQHLFLLKSSIPVGKGRFANSSTQVRHNGKKYIDWGYTNKKGADIYLSYQDARRKGLIDI